MIRRREAARTVRVLPGARFFVRAVDLPTELDRADIDSFAELTLEQLAPFPLDQLAWGFLHRPGSRRILLYAAYLDRLEVSATESATKEEDHAVPAPHLEDAWHAFPDFVVAAAARSADREGDGVSVIRTADALAAVRWTDEDPIPAQAVSLPLPPGGDLAVARGELAERLGCDSDAMSRIPIPNLVEVAIHRDESLGIRLRPERDQSGNADEETSGEAPECPFGIPGSERWRADVRSAAFADQQRRERRAARRVWIAAVAATGFAALLILGQFAMMGMERWNRQRAARIVEREDAVLHIESRLDLLQKLQQFAQNEMRPFVMLELINTVRPDSVYFTRAIVPAYDEISVEGQGETVDAVNQFADRIGANPLVTAVSVEPELRRNVAYFDLRVTFSEPPYMPNAVAGVERTVEDEEEDR